MVTSSVQADGLKAGIQPFQYIHLYVLSIILLPLLNKFLENRSVTLKIVRNKGEVVVMEQHIRIRKVAHEAVAIYVKSNGRGSAKRLAKDLGISPTIISEILNNPNRETKMNTCAKIINFLRDEIDISTLSAIETDAIENSPIDIAHRNIIQRFENKELAKEINGKLLELEGYDSALLLKASAYIDGLLDAVRPMKNGTNGLD
jgi:hypothetical protein